MRGTVQLPPETIIKFGLGYGAPEAGILHELIHALGFNHEYTRADSTDSYSSGNCSARTPEEGDFGTTVYDSASMMNSTYCHWQTQISTLDQVGLTYAYPDGREDRLTVPFSFPLPNGSLLTGAPDTARIEFAQRVQGIIEFHYAEAAWFSPQLLYFPQFATGGSVTIAQALQPPFAAPEVWAEFTDYWGRTRVTPTVTILRNRDRAVALLDSAIRAPVRRRWRGVASAAAAPSPRAAGQSPRTACRKRVCSNPEPIAGLSTEPGNVRTKGRNS